MRHASLFSGIGGPEVAAAMLGWANVFHCEINPFGRRVLEYWFPNSDSYADIKTTDFTKYQGQIDVLTGGFPCQPFSYAGQRRGADDDRYLWPEFKRVISEVQPAWVIGENVAGIASMVEPGETIPLASQTALFDEGNGVRRYRNEQPFTLERVCKDLEELGYTVQPFIIPACAVYAPHRRDRVFIIAADTKSQQGEQHEPQQPSARRSAQGELGGGNSKDSGVAGCGRWDDFPYVPAVHRGNDGLPFDVHDLTIPFTQWRSESIKAFGNAIVPQVMYEIFKAIDNTSTSYGRM